MTRKKVPGAVRDPKDPRVARAVSIKLSAPHLSLPACMRAAEMTHQDSTDTAKQMWIRRRVQKATAHVSLSDVPDIIETGSPETETSSVTVSKSTSRQSAKPNMTAPAKQMMRVADKAARDHYSAAVKAATKLYAEEKTKMRGLSAAKVEAKVKSIYGVGPTARTITRYHNENRIGVSPKKRGKEGFLPRRTFKLLCQAFESYVRINQINAQESDNTRKILAAKVNAVVRKRETETNMFLLLSRILKETALDLNAKKSEKVEDRRIRWTTLKNLAMWFDNWEKELEELGFGTRDSDGNFNIPDEQLLRIINIDETCLSLDGSSGNRGGRPEVHFYDPRLPSLGKATSKSALTTTMIGGSNALGEAVPPHFQFQTSAQTTDTMRLRNDLVRFIPKVRGKFGRDTEFEWSPTFGMNTKGGMDDCEFEKYMMNSLVALYPDARDEEGLRVLVKVDSGPGRLNPQLLARLRLMGFYLYPGVPNTTAVTQETDRNYGPFKSQFRKNLDLVVQRRIKAKVSVSLQPWLVGFIVFGGLDPETNELLEESAFEVGFSRMQCRKAWEKIGAAPLTRACLNDPKVRRELGDSQDNTNHLMLEIQEANNVSTYALDRLGFDASYLTAKINEATEDNAPVTVANTKERVEALARAKTHGQKFKATGGGHVTSDDFFKSIELAEKAREVDALVRKKEECLLAIEIETRAREVLALGKETSKLRAKDLEPLLL